MKMEFRFYIPGRPSNITMYVIVHTSADTMDDCKSIALEYVLDVYPRAELDNVLILDATE